jgi:hypothetical protein
MVKDAKRLEKMHKDNERCVKIGKDAERLTLHAV